MAHLVGKPAPAITGVKDQNGNDFNSAGIFGSVPVVLFFYPQAMTMGCAHWLFLLFSHASVA
jgi:peroxiredoxin